MPAYASVQVVYGTNFLNTLLAAYKTIPLNPLVDTAKIRLSTNPAYNPNPGDTVAGNAASEADFSGYPAGGIAVALGGEVNLSPSCQGTIATSSFIATTAAPFVTGTVYGYWVDDGTNVICGEKFSQNLSFTFGEPGDFLELILQLPAQAVQLTQ